MSWEKLEPLTEQQAGFRSGCLNCGPQPVALPLSAMLCVGFGDCTVRRDGQVVYSEMEHARDSEPPALAVYEEIAQADPDHDWQAHFYGPLSEAVYQRHGEAKWLLVKKGLGFA